MTNVFTLTLTDPCLRCLRSVTYLSTVYLRASYSHIPSHLATPERRNNAHHIHHCHKRNVYPNTAISVTSKWRIPFQSQPSLLHTRVAFHSHHSHACYIWGVRPFLFQPSLSHLRGVFISIAAIPGTSKGFIYSHCSHPCHILRGASIPIATIPGTSKGCALSHCNHLFYILGVYLFYVSDANAFWSYAWCQ